MRRKPKLDAWARDRLAKENKRRKALVDAKSALTTLLAVYQNRQYITTVTNAHNIIAGEVARLPKVVKP